MTGRKKKRVGLGADGLSKYQRKLKKRKLESRPNKKIGKVAPQEHKKIQIPAGYIQQQFDSEIFGISTYTNYISKNGNPGVIIRPRSREPKIYSFLIIEHNGYINYSINKRGPYGIRELPIVNSNLEELYEEDWMVKNRPAQLELYVIIEAMNAQKSLIEKHLNRDIRI